MQLVEAGNTAFQCLAKYVCNCCLAASTVHPEQHDESINQSVSQSINQPINQFNVLGDENDECQ